MAVCCAAGLAGAAPGQDALLSSSALLGSCVGLRAASQHRRADEKSLFSNQCVKQAEGPELQQAPIYLVLRIPDGEEGLKEVLQPLKLFLRMPCLEFHHQDRD